MHTTQLIMAASVGDVPVAAVVCALVAATVEALCSPKTWLPHVSKDEDAEVVAGRVKKWGITTLKLDRCGLKSLPVYKLCIVAYQIKELDVSYNKLRELSGAFLQSCTALEILNCSDNKLSSLPEAIGECTALQKLDCGSNCLSSLPEKLCMCTALQELSCHSTNLSSLPVDLGACTALQSLVCFHTKLESLPAGLGACKVLHELWCSHTQLSALPAELGQCTALRKLDCSYNKLRVLPVELGLLNNLTIFSCRNNPFEEGALTTIEALRAATHKDDTPSTQTWWTDFHRRR